MFTLTAKAWQVFLIVLLALLLLNTNINDSSAATAGLYVIGLVIYCGWFAVLGNTMVDWLPRGAYYSRTWFLLDVFIVLLSFGVVAVLFDDHSYTATGLAALLVFYLFFALGHMFWFPAVVLVAIEKNREPEFGFYFGTLLLMIFWPVGVWFVQPRLNRIAAERLSNAPDSRS